MGWSAGDRDDVPPRTTQRSMRLIDPSRQDSHWCRPRVPTIGHPRRGATAVAIHGSADRCWERQTCRTNGKASREFRRSSGNRGTFSTPLGNRNNNCTKSRPRIHLSRRIFFRFRYARTAGLRGAGCPSFDRTCPILPCPLEFAYARAVRLRTVQVPRRSRRDFLQRDLRDAGSVAREPRRSVDQPASRAG